MKISELKKAGYYILISIDERKKQKMYEIVKDISDTEKSIYAELNRAAFLKAKNEMGFSTKTRQSSFLNFIPFAVTNKEKTPIMETYIINP